MLGRIGLTGSFIKGRARLHADVELTRHEDYAFMGGAEFDVTSMFTLRGGYDGRNRMDASERWTVGLGVRVNSLTLDYAYAPFGALGDNHRVGLSLSF